MRKVEVMSKHKTDCQTAIFMWWAGTEEGDHFQVNELHSKICSTQGIIVNMDYFEKQMFKICGKNNFKPDRMNGGLTIQMRRAPKDD